MLDIDFSLRGPELHKQLLANKTALIAQKKKLIVKSDGIAGGAYLQYGKPDGSKSAVIGAGTIPDNAISLQATIIANTAYFHDSQDDVLLPGCWNKSIKDGTGRLHLEDHDFKLKAELGVVRNVLKSDIALSDFGYQLPGTVESLIYVSEVRKRYNEIMFGKYAEGLVKQHSISLMYDHLTLAVNNPEDKEAYAEWNKHIGKIINREHTEEKGYFFPVYVIKLIECSAVLLGSNELTPTLEVKSFLGAALNTPETPPLGMTGTDGLAPLPVDYKSALTGKTFLNF